VAVVGHVEWVQFARVPDVPRAGGVLHASEAFEEPAGGGAVAAVQLARLGAQAVLVTALGEDGRGDRSATRLRELGVEVRAARRAAATRWAVTLLDDAGERTITTFGPRLEPSGEDAEIGWDSLGALDGVYFTAGDLPALRAAREASRILVASPRAGEALGHGVALDALVLSGADEIELRAAERAEAHAEIVVLTEAERGGSYRTRTGEAGRWAPIAPAAALVDSYGCGDSFAAGLTFGLAAGLALAESLALGARCGAACLTGRGPYGRQLRGGEVRGLADD
jgi:ribokinase